MRIFLERRGEPLATFGADGSIEAVRTNPANGVLLRSGIDIDIPVPEIGEVAAPVLSALSGTFNLREDANQGAAAGVLAGRTPGSLIELVDDAGGVVQLVGLEVRRGSVALDFEASNSHLFTVRETLPGASNGPSLESVLELTVTDLEAPSFTVAPTISGTPDGSQNLVGSYQLAGDPPTSATERWIYQETGAVLGVGKTLFPASMGGITQLHHIVWSVDLSNSEGGTGETSAVVQFTGGVPGPPIITSGAPPATVAVGGTYDYTLVAEGGEPPLTVTLEYEDGTPAVPPPGFALVGSNFGGVAAAHPALASPTDLATGPNTATVGATPNKDSGTLHWWVALGATIPGTTDAERVANLKAGVGAAKFGAKTVTAANAQTATVSGLSSGTPYNTRFVFHWQGHDSAIVSGGGFTTEAAAAVSALYDFNADAGTYWQNSIATGTSGTSHSAPSGLAGYSFAASGAVREHNGDGTIANFIADAPAITDEGFWSRKTRTNLFVRTGPLTSELSFSQRCTNTTAPAGFPFANWLNLDNTTGQAIARYIFTPVANKQYTMVAYVEAPDGVQPVASNSSTSGDFRFRLGGYPDGTFSYQRVGTTNVWRVVAHLTAPSAPLSHIGVYREGGQNTRPLKFSGFHFFDDWIVDPPIVLTTGASAARGESLLSHNIFANGAALPDGNMLILARSTPFVGGAVALQLGTATDNIQLSFAGTVGPPLPQFLIYNASSVVYSLESPDGVPAGEEVVTLFRRLNGSWRGGFYRQGALTWMGPDVAGGVPTVTKAIVGNYEAGGYPLDGIFHRGTILVGAFADDGAVIDAAGAM